MGLVFSVLEEGQRTQRHLNSLTAEASRQWVVCPYFPGNTPADAAMLTHPQQCTPIASSSWAAPLWSLARLYFLFHSCAGLPVCAENQFKVHKKVTHLVLGTSDDQGPLSGPFRDCMVMESQGQALSLTGCL